MQHNTRQLVFGAVMGIAVLTLILLTVGLFTVYTGSYNVAATWNHPPLVRWGLDTAMENSVAAQALEIEQRSDFPRAMVVAGAARYQAMCQHCHGGPGAEQADWATGMMPQPPRLPEVIPRWQPREVFWLVKHGLRLSGMPAFGVHHDDAALWEVTAFVMDLPGMTAQDYTSMLPSEAAHSH